LLIGRIRVGGFPVLYGISHVSAEVSNWSCAVFDGNSYAKVVELPLSGAAWNRFHSTIANLPLAAASE
jgi:predicted P-loop ATPase/GTPase